MAANLLAIIARQPLYVCSTKINIDKGPVKKLWVSLNIISLVTHLPEEPNHNGQCKFTTTVFKEQFNTSSDL